MKSLIQEVVPVYVPNHIFAQMCLPKCKDTYFILQNKYLRMERKYLEPVFLVLRV